MQTFLPYPDFSESAAALDRRRLGKQRVENLQIMKAMLAEYLGESKRGWFNHPAKKMWDGFAWALLQYHRAIVHEWCDVRGYKDTCLQKTIDVYYKLPPELQNEGCYPTWLGNTAFHAAHRSNLIRKDPDKYKTFTDVPPTLEYVWPE